MISVDRDLGDVATDVYVARAVGRLVVADPIGVAVPELAVERAAPTANPPAGEQGAGVVATRRDLGNRAADVDVACGER